MPQLKQQQLHAVSIQQQQKSVVFTIQGSKLLNIAQFFIFHIYIYIYMYVITLKILNS